MPAKPFVALIVFLTLALILFVTGLFFGYMS